MNAPAQLFDLTAVHVTREMYRAADDPLADPKFNRHIAEPTTEDQRSSQSERLRGARRAA